MGFVILLPVLFKTSLIQRSQNLVGRTLFSIKGANIPYEKLEHLWHILFTAHNQVDFSIANIQGNTIPAKKWSILYIVFGHTYNMFSQHPKSTGKATIDDILYIIDLKTRTTFKMNEVFVLVLLISRKLQFLLFNLIYFQIFLLPLFF